MNELLSIDFLREILISGKILSQNPCEEPNCENGSTELVIDYKGHTYSVITNDKLEVIYQDSCQEI